MRVGIDERREPQTQEKNIRAYEDGIASLFVATTIGSVGCEYALRSRRPARGHGMRVGIDERRDPQTQEKNNRACEHGIALLFVAMIIGSVRWRVLIMKPSSRPGPWNASWHRRAAGSPKRKRRMSERKAPSCGGPRIIEKCSMRCVQPSRGFREH
jgi:hypothetical protein